MSSMRPDGIGDVEHELVCECHIAGFRYHEGLDIMQYLVAGEALDLIAEPDNLHDQWAVRVEHRKSRIGYLPRRHNQPVSRLMQQGVAVKCCIVGVNPAAPPWEAVRIRLATLTGKTCG